MRSLVLGVALSLGVSASSRADGPAFHLDPLVMRAANCSVDVKSLRPMPLRIGRTPLDATLRARLRMLAWAAPSRIPPKWAFGTLQSNDGSKSLKRVRELAGRKSGQPDICPGMSPAFFIAGVGNGMIHEAVVAVVTAPLDVWRVHSDRPSYCGHTKVEGPWWALTDPRSLPKGAYRKRNGICLSWNRLTHVTHCRLKPGAPVAIGPTESVTRSTCSCNANGRRRSGDGVANAYIAEDSYKADSTLQLYVNTYAAKGLAPLMTCDAPVAWK